MIEAAYACAETMGLPAAIATITANPARMCRMADRGRIAPGLRGDLVLIDPFTRRVAGTLVAGRSAHMTSALASRLR